MKGTRWPGIPALLAAVLLAGTAAAQETAKPTAPPAPTAVVVGGEEPTPPDASTAIGSQAEAGPATEQLATPATASPGPSEVPESAGPAESVAATPAASEQPEGPALEPAAEQGAARPPAGSPEPTAPAGTRDRGSGVPQPPSQKPTAAAEAAEALTPEGAPVVFAGSTLFTVADRLGPFSPEERATSISGRLAMLAASGDLDRHTLTVVEGDEGFEIRHGETVLLTVTPDDATAVGRAAGEVAQSHADLITRALSRARRSATVRTLLMGALFTLLATAALVVLLRLSARAFPAMVGLIGSWRGTVIPSLRIQRFELVSADRIADLAIFVVKMIRVVLVLIALYIYLPLVFGFFPWTRGLSRTLFGYVLTPLEAAWVGILDFLPNLFFIGVIALLTYYALRLLRVVFREIERGAITLPNFDPEWADPTYKIVRFLVLAFALVVTFPYLPGAASPAFKGVSIFLGLLISLGSSSAIANIVAGVILTYTGAFRIGDRVKISDTVGDVLKKTLLVTRVRTVKNVEVTIPNAMVLGSHIINYSVAAKKTRGLILHTRVTIGYDVPWRQVHELLIDAAHRTSGVLPEPEPFVLQLSLDDHYPSYEVNGYTDQPGAMARIYSELHQNIQDVFNEAGVEILSPAYSAVRDGNAVAIPQDYLPESYQAPAFRVLPLELPRAPGRRRPSSRRTKKASEDEEP